MPAPERFRLSQSLARNGREVWEVDLAPDIRIPVLEKGKDGPEFSGPFRCVFRFGAGHCTSLEPRGAQFSWIEG